MGTLKITLPLVKMEMGNWFFLFVPNSALGTASRVRLKGTLNGKPFEATANPWQDEQHNVAINAEMRKTYGLSGGEDCALDVEVIAGGAPKITPPDDLVKAMKAGGAKAAFEKLAPSHLKEYVRWLDDAKQPETRARRLARAVEMVKTGADAFDGKAPKTAATAKTKPSAKKPAAKKKPTNPRLLPLGKPAKKK